MRKRRNISEPGLSGPAAALGGARPKIAAGAWSLRLRLSLFFASLLLVAGLVAALFSWWASRDNIDTFFDTQQMLFAKRLASARYESLAARLPDTDDILAAAGRGDEGEQEDDALAFAVFDSQGRLLMSDGDNGRDFVFTPKANGFVNTRVDDDWWRIVWLTSLDGRVVVAVGQELEYREDMAMEILAGQMLPWLLLLPLLLLGLTLALSRELKPLRSVAAALEKRNPDDFRPIAIGVQSEIKPLIQALNSLFIRVEAMFRRERDFIANAAHELRTPLAGLSIQAQVANSARQPEARTHALAQLRKGINRTSRLVDQLLLLFRLESIGQNSSPQSEPCNVGASVVDHQTAGRETLTWSSLLEAALEEAGGGIEAKKIRLDFSDESAGAAVRGQKELLEVMLGNLVGNALKYTPEEGTIELRLEPRSLTIRNSSRDISPSDAARLGERFFRPPGQNEAGSGLGLSIAGRIAEMHGLKMAVKSLSGLFEVKLYFS